MRLMIFWPDYSNACTIRERMEMAGWDADIQQDGRKLCQLGSDYDVLLIHLCLPGMDGLSAGDAYAASGPVCPPRILFMAPGEWCVHQPAWADCTVEAGIETEKLCKLLHILAQKPLPRLAMAQKKLLAVLTRQFLDELSFKKTLKGRAYAAWLLERMIPSTRCPSLNELYTECAAAYQTTPAAVERCLRVAVEGVFTQGSLTGIERFFGATVDPERGKPTNRAFLLQAAQQLRYSLTDTRSLNSSEMHHSPAAPTSV